MYKSKRNVVLHTVLKRVFLHIMKSHKKNHFRRKGCKKSFSTKKEIQEIIYLPADSFFLIYA